MRKSKSAQVDSPRVSGDKIPLKAFIQGINSNPKFQKAFHWGKLVTITGTAQVLIQIMSLVAGILIIRLLPTSEYALYTLANTMLGTMAVLSDSGITVGVMSEAGKVWGDKSTLGSVLATGLKLRRKFGITGLLITGPILMYLLLSHGASWLMTVLITLSLVPAFFATLSDSLLEVPPKLHQDIGPLQKNGLLTTIGRLVLTGSTNFLFPFTFVAILAGGIPRIWANIQLKKISIPYVDWNQSSDPVIEEKILKTVKRTLPSSIYFCVSGQITVWLISIFGSTESVAQLGALGRLSMILSIFTVMFQILIIPRYARLPSNKPIILRWFVLLQILLAVFALVVIVLAHFFAKDILWIIGKNYAGLEDMLVLAIASAVIGAMSGVLFGILMARNWIMHPALSIGVGIVSQIVLISIVDLSTLRGIYYFSILNTLVGIVLSYVYVVYRVRTAKPV